MKSILPSFIILSATLYGDPNFGMQQQQSLSPKVTAQPDFAVHNEVLIKVNNDAISVMDVVKEMDMIFTSSYPNLVDSKQAKYQFYTSSWKQILQQMVNKELIILDAEGKVEVSEGEIREELERKFGPSVIHNLDKMNLSLEEAKERTKKEIIFQRMSWYFIHNQASGAVTPQVLKKAYEAYLQKNPPKTEWTYQVITIRGNEEEETKALSVKIANTLKEKAQNLPSLSSEILALEERKGMIKISDEFTNDSKDISKNHQQGLENLEEYEYSLPIQQTGKNNARPTYRIFYLKKKQTIKPKSFAAMTKQLQNELTQEQSSIEAEKYISRLRKQYGMENQTLLVPDDFNPFVLK